MLLNEMYEYVYLHTIFDNGEVNNIWTVNCKLQIAL